MQTLVHIPDQHLRDRLGAAVSRHTGLVLSTTAHLDADDRDHLVTVTPINRTAFHVHLHDLDYSAEFEFDLDDADDRDLAGQNVVAFHEYTGDFLDPDDPDLPAHVRTALELD